MEQQELWGVKCFFVQETPASYRAGNQTVNFGTNGGHTGYFLFCQIQLLIQQEIIY
jgi:hypothetical protein